MAEATVAEWLDHGDRVCVCLCLCLCVCVCLCLCVCLCHTQTQTQTRAQEMQLAMCDALAKQPGPARTRSAHHSAHSIPHQSFVFY